MSVLLISEALQAAYMPECSMYRTYKEESVYCDFAFAKNKIFVVSLNVIDAAIYVYYRKKQVIDNLSEIIPGIAFSSKKDVYFYKAKHLSDAERVALMTQIIRFVDLYAKNISLEKFSRDENEVLEYSNHKIKIVGNYFDSKNNKIIAPKNLHDCFVQFLGGNNEIVIDEHANLKNCSFEMRENGKVLIGAKVSLHGQMRVGYGSHVEIGAGTSSTDEIYATISEGSRLVIGNDCMFATNNQIRTDDAHPIYDVNTGKRLNPSKDIIIGDHVWVGYGAVLFGGAKIGDGSVVGAFSMVNKEFPNNAVLVGTPAKMVKSDVFWERSPLLVTSCGVKNYTPEELETKPYCKKTVL